MAQKSGFFNALQVGGEYDRKYNADDYSSNLAMVISNGVLRSSNDDLKVTATGMVCKVAAGRAWINGHWYYNDATANFSATTAPSGGARWDRIILRLNNNLNDRNVTLRYLQGVASNNPVKPTPTRNATVYDLVLADVYVTAGATSLAVTDTRPDPDLCGWMYSTSGDNSFFTSLDNAFNTWFAGVKDNLSSVTLFKRYNWRTVLSSSTRSVSFSIPQYDANTCFIEVYVNGILETLTTDYTISGSVLTFSGTLTAGTEVEVKCFKSIDGTGIMTVSDEITQLQNQVAGLTSAAKFTYTCTGVDDNISLSQIAQAIISGSYVASSVTAAAAAFLSGIGGNTFLGNLTSNSQVEIEVVGETLNATTPYAGSGTASSRYRWFSLGASTAGEKKIIFDFAKCGKITVAPNASTSNVIFFGTDLILRNVNCSVYTTASGCDVEMIAGATNTGNIDVSDCRFVLRTSGKAVIASNGNFTNCYCKCTSAAGHAQCFTPKSASLIRLIGGTYYAYVGVSTNTGAIFYTTTGEADAVIMAYNINCPVVAVSGYYQSYLAVGYDGNTYINGVITTLNTLGSYVTVNGKVSKTKR